jgi:Chemoreceptor zinc-binding domain
MDPLQKQRAESVVKAHIGWFEDLRKAMETGQSDMAPAVVAVDTECEFGKWVHSELRALCSADLFEQIKRIHADFHRAAAAILTLALNGRQADARARLGGSSELGELSKRLIQKVQELR